MAFRVQELRPLNVPSFCTFLLLICSVLSGSHAKQFKHPGSDQDELGCGGTLKPLDAIVERFHNNGDIMLPDESIGSHEKSINLSSVLLLAAATAITATVANSSTSKYRRKKDQDKLANICKANKNFHETVKLGKGGFGTVNRVTIRPVALRHKDMVPLLVGRTYNKVMSRARQDKIQAMAFQVLHKLPLRGVVPSLCTILLLICSPLCCSLVRSDTVSSTTYDTMDNSLLPGPIDSYLGKASFGLNLTESAALHIPHFRPLNFPMVLFHFSFTMAFNVFIHRASNLTKANSSVVLALHTPIDHSSLFCLCELPSIPQYGTFNPRPRSYPAAASNISAQINIPDHHTVIFWVQIDIDPSHNFSFVENRYKVRIHYDDITSLISIYVEGDGIPEPVNEATMIHTGTRRGPMSMSIGHFSTMGQQLILDNWIFKLDDDMGQDNFSFPPQVSRLTAILSSVLGSAAAIAITAAVVYFYFNSKYRRWKNEQDKLAKIMQGLPGVPAKIDFTDIKKATKNFHETMKLGKGGFGAVYRCILPAAASRTGQGMEVAVKKFLQEVEDRRYDDFLAEVSIINRLRHKNIVPLVGWSYNKGVPLLVYEFMTNGSLDQHLFPGGSNRHHNRDAAIWQWDTRYSIVRDIATGLHYVHDEHEPMVLHRDIKASNILLDSTFRARLGDFGIACAVAANKSSVTGIAGTFGYIAPDYAMSHKATRQTDIYAFGVLILEVVTGKKNGDVRPEDDHITEWVWRLHREGKLLEAVDSVLIAGDNNQDAVIDEVKRMLLLGLACTNPNSSNRPSMVEVVQIITQLAPPPEVPLEKPTFVWPPEDWRTRNSVYSTAMSNWDKSSASTTTELVQFSHEFPSPTSTGGQAFVYSRAASESRSVEMKSRT